MADFTHVFSKDAAPRKFCFFAFCFVLNYLVYIVCVYGHGHALWLTSRQLPAPTYENSQTPSTFMNFGDIGDN